MEETVCHALPPTGINVSLDQLHSCHMLNKKDQVVVKFKCRKQAELTLQSQEFTK